MKKISIVFLTIVFLIVPQLCLAKSGLELARDYITIGKNYEAKGLINDEILKDPLNARLHLKAASLYMEMNDIGAYKKASENACKLDNSNCKLVARDYQRLGFIYLNSSGGYNTAMNYFSKAIKMHPDQKSFIITELENKGNFYLGVKDIKKSDLYHTALISLQPSSKERISNLYLGKSSEMSVEQQSFFSKEL